MKPCNHATMNRFFLSILILLTGMTLLLAQSDAQIDYRMLVGAIGKEVKQGDKRALRDLGTLLDEPQVQAKAIEILKEHTLFTNKEILLNQDLNKKTFLDFYYKKENQLYFSPLLKAFYSTPVAARNVETKLESFAKTKVVDPYILLKKYVRNLEAAFEEKEEENILAQVDSIAALGSNEAYEVLLTYLGNDFSFFKNKKVLYERLLKALVHYPKRETLRKILALVKKENLNSEQVLLLLAQLTNVKLQTAPTSSTIVQKYEHYLDSLGSIKHLRAFGYATVVGFKSDFFEFEVDYYGKILSQADDYPWIQFNALKDIQKTQHPRALFYIAAQIFHYRDSDKSLYSNEQYLALLQRITHIKVAIKNQFGDWVIQADWKKDKVALVHFLLYWASQYEDYEWDEVRMNFVNKNEAVAQTEIYERLFRRLNSTNDSVAWASYQQLAQGDPIEVVNLAKKYKDLLRSYNKTLAPIKYQYLEQLVRLTDFCRRNDFVYLPQGRLLEQLESLKNPILEQERFEIENQIIQELKVSETAILEYWGCLYANNRDFSFSIGRILTWVYTEQWNRIIGDDDLLRFYLKKAHLLSQIGVIGVCNSYLKQFENLDTNLKVRLENLIKSESDKDIIHMIRSLLTKGETSNILASFLESPLSFEKKDIKNLPPLGTKDYLDVFDVIQLEENEQAAKRVFEYVKMHAQINMVPDLMRLLQMQIRKVEVVQVLFKIYNTKDSPENWLKKWYEEQDSFQQWGQQFFDEKLKILETQEVLTIKDINAITTSSFYKKKHKKTCLEALKKVKKVRNIRRLKIEPLLSIQEDLDYFTTFNFSYKELDDIPKLFDINDEIPILLDFLKNQSSSFSIEEKGAFFNSLFRSAWFVKIVNEGVLSRTQADNIELALKTYLYESELISEFEEQATIQNIAQLKSLGKSLEEKLKDSFRLNVDAAAKAKIQKEIIANLTYQDLPIIMTYYDKLSPVYRYNFLNMDFGLPIFELDNVQVHQTFIEQHQQLTRPELYQYYLEAFGLDFQDENGALDYPKILKILDYDIVMPFVNGGGTQRDFCVFGLIKLLEFEFNTKLGFHEKLNENQTFYSFSASKRAAAWRAYLKEKVF